MGDRRRHHRYEERGSALVYILIAIALLAALTVSFMNPSSNQTSSQNTFRTVSEVKTQIDFIRSAIQECVLLHPGGDINVISFTSSQNYPILPDETYLNTCVPNPAEADGTHDVRLIRCPGNPGDDECHADMFGGASGKFLPPPPALFGEWQYYNRADGVFFWIESEASDAFIDTVLDRLEEDFSECEADVMRPTGSDFQMTSDMGNEIVCPEDSRCFRIWMKQQTNPAFGDPTFLSADEIASCT